jgi:succinoglycan biosynthesis transport protein ExoP
MKLLREQPEQPYRRRASDKAQVYAPGAGRAVSPGGEQPVFRLDMMRSLQLHRRLAMGIFLAGFLGAAAYLVSLWPLYTAKSVVYVQPAPPRVMDQGYAARWPFDANTYESYLAQQLVNVTRYDVLISALHKLEPGTWQHKNESDQVAAERLGRAIEVKRLGTSYEMSIAARASNADLAARLANAVAASYIESAASEGRSGDAQRLAMLREEEERVKRELTADRDEQHGLNTVLGVAGVGSNTPDLLDEDLSRVRSELIRARSASDEAAARLTSVDAKRTHSTAALDAEADQMLSADTGLASMKVTLFQRRATLTSQMANLTPNHPQYKQAEEELAQINNTLEAMTRDLRDKASARIQQRLRTELERTSGEESRLNAQLGQMAGAASGMTPKMQRQNDLAADIIRLQGRYSSVDEQLHNILLDAGAPAASYLAAAAVPPLHPTKSGVMRNTFVIGLAGLMLGIIAAVTANKLDQRVYIASDVEQVLGFAPMAALPDFTQVSEEAAEEHMLRLSAGIEYARQQGNLKSCIFTGTGSGTGVTTVATRVRSTLESLGRATVLVDASGTPPPPASATAGGLGLNDASSELARQRGSRPTAVLQTLAEEADSEDESLVLTDAAPLSVSAETEYMARFVDAAIVVIQSGVTTRTQLREAASTLQRLDVTAVGFVLNRVGLEKADASFRRSVCGIEQHLRAQSSSHAKGAERKGPAVPEASSKVDQAPREPVEEVGAAAQAAKPDTGPEAAVRPPAPRVPEIPARSQEPSLLRTHTAPGPRVETASLKMPRLEELFQPVHVSAPEPPRSKPVPEETQARQQSVRQPQPPRTPLVRGRGPQAEAAGSLARTSEPEAAVGPPPPPIPGLPSYFSASPALAESRPTESIPPQAAPVQPVLPQSAPVQSAPVQPPPVRSAPSQDRERAVGLFYKSIDPEPAEVESLQPEPADVPDNTAMRMSGLRNLLLSLGTKNLNMPAEGRERSAEIPPYQEQMQRLAYGQSYPEQTHSPFMQNSGRRDAAAASPRLVTAPPEFLPPKTVADADDDEQGRKGSSIGRRDRRDAYDDVEILPSWRGQYKKK